MARQVKMIAAKPQSDPISGIHIGKERIDSRKVSVNLHDYPSTCTYMCSCMYTHMKKVFKKINSMNEGGSVKGFRRSGRVIKGWKM